jgi:ABC-2 type transport system ATP-binding protein
MRSVEVDHLSKWFSPGLRVLDDLTFRVEGSGAVGYLGPNGAGKTTTLKLLMGLLAPSEGHAYVNGHDPMSDRRRALIGVGAVIESPEPYPSESIYDALERVGQLRGLAAETIDTEIDRCHGELHLPPLARRSGGLSKGERQRVVLAAACLGDPGILLLDEPTNGMDPGERAEVRQFLIRLKRDHLIFMSSHLITDVAEICDRALFIDRGRVLFHETVEKVSDHVHSQQMDVEFAHPTPLEALGPISSSLRKVVRLTDRKFRFTFDGADETRSRLIEECVRIGPLSSCSPTAPALEDAYREIMAGNYQSSAEAS